MSAPAEQMRSSGRKDGEGPETGVAALEVESISKSFPGQLVLDSVSLSIEAGEVHALLGENGSGKSTLIKILSGFHPPDPGGRVAVAGEQLALGRPAASARAGLRFVHQKGAVIPELNAIENIALEAGYGRRAFIDWRAQADYASSLLARLGVQMDVWRPLQECRAVERSAVAIARALRPSEERVALIVLDEPSASLPDAEVRQLFALIREVTASGVAVLYVSHRLDEVFEIADRVSVLRDGSMRGTEPTAALSRERLVQMIVGRDLAEDYESPTRRGRPSTAGAPALRVSRLSTGRLRDVSFELRAGEVLGVVGLTGSGSEELAPALVGATAARAGTITVADREVSPITPDRALAAGLMLALSNTQPGSALAEFNVRENITLACLSRHRRWLSVRSGHERREASEWVGSLDVRPSDTERRYSLLSGGNQQKVILAKWLNAKPKVLVLDEPTAGVDVGARQAIYELIAQEAARGLGVVICSSDFEDIVSTCDRALVLRNGSVAAELDASEITEESLLLAAAGGAHAESPAHQPPMESGHAD